jgi:hypothetical protein
MTLRPWHWTLLLALLTASWVGYFAAHPEHLPKAGVGHYRVEVAPQSYHEVWFLDLFAILAANDAVAAGLDPYARNPLDYMRRPHVYGPLWLHLRHLGFTRADVRWLGAALGGAFLLAAVLWLRPGSAGALLWSAAVLCSTPVLAAVERANNDLAVFLVLAPVVPCLLSGRAAVRWLAVPLLALAAELKIYPAAAALVLLATADRTERWRQLLATAVALALVGWHLIASLPPARTILPPLHGVFNFGAEIVLRQLGFAGAALWLIPAALAVLIGLLGWRSPLLAGWQPAAAQRSEVLHFNLAASLLAGCFFAGQHFAYRWIFAVWLVPLLWSLATTAGSAPPRVRSLARLTAGLLLTVLWFETIAVYTLSHLSGARRTELLDDVWRVMQPVEWALATLLILFIAHFARLNLSSRPTPAS